MIRAGLLLIEGRANSTFDALIQAGYSPNTARNPRANGLTAARLIREAVEAGSDDPFACLQALSMKTCKDFDARPGPDTAFRTAAVLEAARPLGAARHPWGVNGKYR